MIKNGNCSLRRAKRTGLPIQSFHNLKKSTAKSENPLQLMSRDHENVTSKVDYQDCGGAGAEM